MDQSKKWFTFSDYNQKVQMFFMYNATLANMIPHPFLPGLTVYAMVVIEISSGVLPDPLYNTIPTKCEVTVTFLYWYTSIYWKCLAIRREKSV
jgi:hypothetical protein